MLGIILLAQCRSPAASAAPAPAPAPQLHRTAKASFENLNFKPTSFPNQQSPLNTPTIMPQDMPPVGGYDAVQYKRNIPVRGLKPVYYLVGMGVIMAYGWRQIFLGNRERIEYAREKAWARIHLTPLLQAEEDRDQARRYFADQAREKQLLGGNTEVYHADRFVRPTFAAAPHVSK